MVDGRNRKSANIMVRKNKNLGRVFLKKKKKPWSRSKVVFSCETASGIVWSTTVNIGRIPLVKAKNRGLGITFPNFWKSLNYILFMGVST